jgi:hypothetical protein
VVRCFKHAHDENEEAYLGGVFHCHCHLVCYVKMVVENGLMEGGFDGWRGHKMQEGVKKEWSWSEM